MAHQPIADRLRPTKLSEMVGQSHLFGKKGVITKVLEQNHLTNMIFYGPPGTGKTTLAGIIAKISGMELCHLNATTATTADVKEVIAKSGSLFGQDGILLYIDEIQYFTKKQQQVLLEYIENGQITLIASTTENPYMYVYNAIISRSMVFEFKAVAPEEICTALERGLRLLNEEHGTDRRATHEVLLHIARCGAGDVRRSLNILESAYFTADEELTIEAVDSLTPRVIGNFDKSGTVHYDLLSCLQKSIRGSDPDAAIFYLAKILEGGDLQGACRRLLVIANEDIGLAYSMASVITLSCVESAMRVGMPEATLTLSHAATFLATCPKSNSAHLAYEAAKADVLAGKGQTIPSHLRPSDRFDGYKYPHDYPGHYVKQQYLPDDLKNKKYYEYAENKTEQAAKAYWELVKGKDRR
ncbi:MAG: replication-associated recombination protein A [Clostridia bacterium]|nr:replication-associated recombination protein A [Clostridia bacterium]